MRILKSNKRISFLVLGFLLSNQLIGQEYSASKQVEFTNTSKEKTVIILKKGSEVLNKMHVLSSPLLLSFFVCNNILIKIEGYPNYPTTLFTISKYKFQNKSLSLLSSESILSVASKAKGFFKIEIQDQKIVLLRKMYTTSELVKSWDKSVFIDSLTSLKNVSDSIKIYMSSM